MRSTVVRSIVAAVLVAFLRIGAEAAWDLSGKWPLVPPGGDGDGEPCRPPRADAYKYTDRSGATDGILSMSVERYGGFRLKGGGPRRFFEAATDPAPEGPGCVGVPRRNAAVVAQHEQNAPVPRRRSAFVEAGPRISLRS